LLGIRVLRKASHENCQLNPQVQMLLNLITNAREELIESEGERQIEVQTAETDQDGKRFVAVSVADSGSGVPADLRDRIFDPKKGLSRDCGHYSAVRSSPGKKVLWNRPPAGLFFSMKSATWKVL
jgi:sensor histidine kinase regulating citrate/malate metabolism